ncbi:MAG TPA: AI-2E family transporter [Vicinamibacterales bacterium]
MAPDVLSYAAAAVLTALAVCLLIVGRSILLPFVIAVFIWHLINALAAVSRRLRIGEVALPGSVRLAGAVALLVLLVWWVAGLVAGNLVWWVAGLVAGNIGHVLQAAPLYEQNLRRLVNRAGSLLGYEELQHLQVLLQSLDVTGLLRTLAATATYLMGTSGTVAIFVVFLLLEQRSFRSKIASLFPDAEGQARAYRVLEQVGSEVQTYVWLKTVMSLIGAVASYVVMKLVRLDLAEFWALLIFALNYIPYIGAWLGVIFPTLLAAAQFGDPGRVLGTAAALAVVQFTTGSILEPRVMGRGLNLSPVIMLLSLAFWGTVWGVVGMLLAVPLMVVVMIVCAHVDSLRPVAVLLSADGRPAI